MESPEPTTILQSADVTCNRQDLNAHKDDTRTVGRSHFADGTGTVSLPSTVSGFEFNSRLRFPDLFRVLAASGPGSNLVRALKQGTAGLGINLSGPKARRGGGAVVQVPLKITVDLSFRLAVMSTGQGPNLD